MRELRWAWWWFEGCLEWRGDCWKLESSQAGLWPTCWHAKPAEGMIVGMILPQSTLIRFIGHKFLWHVVPILWCDRRWQKQPSPNEPWLLQISSRLASTKEVDLKSKVQQEFYRNERKRQGHSAIVECHIHKRRKGIQLGTLYLVSLIPFTTQGLLSVMTCQVLVYNCKHFVITLRFFMLCSCEMWSFTLRFVFGSELFCFLHVFSHQPGLRRVTNVDWFSVQCLFIIVQSFVIHCRFMFSIFKLSV